MARKAARGMAAALVATAGAVMWQTAAANAAAPDRVGWWSQAQPSSGTLPNATANPGELEVAGSPAGPLAFAAIHYTVPTEMDGQSADPTQATGSFILSVAPNSSSQGATLQVCPTTSQWKPEENGAMSGAPQYKCPTTPVAGQISPDGNTVTWNLTSSLMTEPGTFDLAILPSGQTPFVIKFSKPDQNSLNITAPPAADTGASAEPPAAPAAVPDTSAAAAPAVLAGPMLPTAAAPTLSVPLTPEAPPTAAPPAPAGSGVATSPSLGLSPARHSSGWTTEREQQAMSVGLLAAIVGALWWVGGATQRAPRLLGPLGGRRPEAAPVAVRVGGVGRFARPRTTAPRPI